ncbi:hypothetical protein YQE_09508, partial [Dendroctonus ponderosae]
MQIISETVAFGNTRITVSLHLCFNCCITSYFFNRFSTRLSSTTKICVWVFFRSANQNFLLSSL